MARRAAARRPLALALLLLLLAAAAAAGREARASEVSILLPADRAEAANGEALPVTKVVAADRCLKWFSTDESVATIEKVRPCQNPDLAQAVKVSAIQYTSGHCEVIALDEDSPSDSVTVEVYVAPITRLEILTTSRRLFRFELETVSVQAYDADSNVFSSLNGLRFEWTSTARSGTALEIKRLSDSKLLNNKDIKQEFYGRMGSQVHINAIDLGPKTLSARLDARLDADRQGPAVQTTVDIDVVDHIDICPSKPVLVVGTSLELRAERKVNHYSTAWITDADEPFEWNSSGDAVDVEAKTGVLHAIQPGHASVRYSMVGYEKNSASAIATVVPLTGLKLWMTPLAGKPIAGKLAEIDLSSAPDALQCAWSQHAMLPQDKRLARFSSWRDMDDGPWVLSQGKRFLFMTTLMSDQVASSTAIFITSEMKFVFSVLSAAGDADSGAGSSAERTGKLSMSTVDSSGLSNLVLVEGTEEGFVDVVSSLHHNGQDYSVRKRRVQVTAPIRLSPRIVRLPLDPAEEVWHIYMLDISGGTGSYTFRIENGASSTADCPAPGSEPAPNVVSVDEHLGELRVNAHLPANETCVVYDTFDRFNQDAVNVIVSEPSSMIFREKVVDVSPDERFKLSAILLDAFGKEYSNCTGFDNTITWNVDKTFIYQESVGVRDHRGDSSICSSRSFIAHTSGTTTITAHFGKSLVATIRITVVHRVKVLEPRPDKVLEPTGLPVALVRVGSTTPLVLSRGKEQDSFEVFQREGEDSHRLNNADAEAMITHIKTQDSKRSYRLVCNTAGDFLIRVQNEAELLLLCRPSKELRITAKLAEEEVHALETDGCGDLDSGKLFMIGGRTVTVFFDLFDDAGRIFTDVSEFKFDWGVEPSDARKHITVRDQRMPQHPSKLLDIPQDFTGPIQLSAKVHDSRGAVMHSATLEIVVAADISLVSTGGAQPVVATADASWPLTIQGGVDALLDRVVCITPSSVVEAKLSVRAREVLVTYSSDRSVGVNVPVMCSMACLIGSTPTQSTVEFREVYRLKLQAAAKLREGQRSQMSLQAFDSAGRAFSASMHDRIAITLEAEPGSLIELPGATSASCVEGSESTDLRECNGEWKLSIKGLRAGNELVRAMTKSGGSAVVERHIFVYQGITLNPSTYLAVEVGVHFKVERSYGPYTDPSRCSFEVSSGDSVRIVNEANGELQAMALGNSTVRAVCRDEDGQELDAAELTVGVLRFAGMTVVPGRAFVVAGDAVRVRVNFPEMTEQPVDFDLVRRQYTWRVANSSVAQVLGEPLHGNEFSVWIRGLAPGVTNISVESTVAGSYPLSAELEFAVETKLEVEIPEEVVLPRLSKLRVATNVDYLVESSSALHVTPGTRGCIGPLFPLRVESNSIIVSGHNTGSGEVIVEFHSEKLGLPLVQRRTIQVSVEPVGFVAVNQLPGELNFPVGVDRTLQVGLYTESGRQFTAPFAFLDIVAQVSNPDVFVAEPLAFDPKAPLSPFKLVSVRGVRPGSTSVAFSLASTIESEAREDYIQINALTADLAFQFDLAPHLNKDGKIFISPGEPLAIGITSLLGTIDGLPKLGCEAKIDGVRLTSRMNGQSNEHMECVIAIPARIPRNASTLSMSLLLASEEINAMSAQVIQGFKVVAQGDAKLSNGVLHWPRGKPTATLHLVGTGGTNLAVHVSNTEEVRTVVAPHKRDAKIVLHRVQNLTCGELGALTITHRATDQSVEIQVVQHCTASGSDLWLPGYTLHLQTLLVGTVVSMLVMCWACSDNCAWTSAMRASALRGPSRREHDSPSLATGLPPRLR